jgi:hypothetical protein
MKQQLNQMPKQLQYLQTICHFRTESKRALVNADALFFKIIFKI